MTEGRNEDLTDEEALFLSERIQILFDDETKEGMSAEEMLMLAYIQGMTECLIHIVRPDLCKYEGSDILMNLAKKMGGMNVSEVDKRLGPNPRLN